jgi:hypothetical protein
MTTSELLRLWLTLYLLPQPEREQIARALSVLAAVEYEIDMKGCASIADREHARWIEQKAAEILEAAREGK